MPFSDGLTQLSNAALTWLILIAGLSVVLYFARQPAHQAILTFTQLLYRALRVASAALMRGEETLRQRNREVLLAAGRDASERMIEREFERIDGATHYYQEQPELQAHAVALVQDWLHARGMDLD